MWPCGAFASEDMATLPCTRHLVFTNILPQHFIVVNRVKTNVTTASRGIKKTEIFLKIIKILFKEKKTNSMLFIKNFQLFFY